MGRGNRSQPNKRGKRSAPVRNENSVLLHQSVNPPDAAQIDDVAVAEPATAKEASVPASTSTQSVQRGQTVHSDTEVMGLNELDTSRDDSNLSSSSPSRDRESDTRNPEDATSVQSLKESDDIKRLSYPPSFFKFIEPSAKNGSSLYACQVKDCPRMGKTLSAINNSRGNLRAHIKTVHKEQLEKFNTLCKEIDATKLMGVQPLRDHSDKKIETDRKPAFVQQVLSFQGYQKLVTQKNLDEFIPEYLCDAVLPVYHTETEAFRTYTRKLQPRLKVRNRAFYRKQIASMYIKKRAALMNQLRGALWICTTADGWTSRRRAFIGITAHWIAPNLKRRSVCLAVRRVIGKCDFEIIAKLLEGVYEEYDILHKLTATVTDNGSNFVKAFRLYGSSSLHSTIERSTSTQNQNAPLRAASLDVLNASTSRTTLQPVNVRSNRMVTGEDNIAALLEDELSDFEETDDEIDSLSDHDHDKEKEDQGESATEQESESEIQENTDADMNPISLTAILNSGIDATNIYILPPHRRCACHTLNLICKCDIYKDLEPALKNLMEATDKKLTAIWNKQNRSSKASDTIIESLGMLFIIHNETRWNSYFNAMQRAKYFVTKKRTELKALFEQFGIAYFRPAEEEFIREYVKVMEPISEALNVLQADVNISIGYLLPTLTILLNKMENLKEKGGIKHCKPLLNTMIESVKRRFAESLADAELHIAAMVHPLFKAKWMPEGEERDAKVQGLVDVFRSFKNDQVDLENRYLYSYTNSMM